MISPHRRFTLSKRYRQLRFIGLGLGFFTVWAALPETRWYYVILTLLAVHCFGWPHVAYFFSSRSPAPASIERRNMQVDAFISGFFAVCVGLNPLPAVVITGMIALDSIGVGGLRLLGISLITGVLGGVLAWLLFSPPLVGVATVLQTDACLPLLVFYPLSIGYVYHLTAAKLERSKKELALLSTTDHLTGLANRMALNDLLNEHISERAKFGPSVVALVDVDYFKQINDSLGHLAGDQLLKQLSQIMRNCVRERDTVSRYGGDEFCIILRDVSCSEAMAILERMRGLAEQNASSYSEQLKTTLSIGAAAYGPRAANSAAWLNEADVALYEAKRAGRNKIVFAT